MTTITPRLAPVLPQPLSKPQANTLVAPAAAPTAHGLAGLFKDVFQKVESKVEHALGMDSARGTDGDGDEGHIDADGMVVPSKDGKTTAANTITGSVNTQYFGGKVLDHPEVTTMYLGDYFKTDAGQKDVAHNDAFFQDLVQNKGFNGILHQYGVDQGSVQPSQLLGGAIKPNQVITQKQIEAQLADAVKNGTVKPGAQSIYNFVLPPGAVLKMDDGTSSLQGLGGFHSSIHTPDGQTVYYSAEVSAKGRNGIDFANGNTQDNLSITESHEFAEAATDPDVGDAAKSNDWTKLGWMDANNGEIGDVEVNDADPGTPLSTMFDRMDGFAVQKIWSQKDGTNEIAAKQPGPVEPLPTPATPPA